jgi:acyl carrier protein
VTETEILDGIARVARDHVGYQGPLDRHLHLVEDLELDSLKTLTLAVELENHFRICLDSETESEIKTIGDLVTEIRRILDSHHH